MKDFSSLLAKLSSALKTDELLKRVVSETIAEVVRGTIKEENISIKNHALYLTCSPVLKSEIKLKEALVLSRIQERSGTALMKIIYH